MKEKNSGGYLILGNIRLPLILVKKSEFNKLKIEYRNTTSLPRFICIDNKNEGMPDFSLIPQSNKIYNILIYCGSHYWNTTTNYLEV